MGVHLDTTVRERRQMTGRHALWTVLLVLWWRVCWPNAWPWQSRPRGRQVKTMAERAQ